MASKSLKNQLEKITTATDVDFAVRDAASKALVELNTPLQTDPWIYRIVVTLLGATVLVTVTGGILLTLKGQGADGWDLSPGIIAIGSAAVGALAGLLAPSPQSK